MRWVAALGFAAAVVGATAMATSPRISTVAQAPQPPAAVAAAEGEQVPVMTRNLYLGADIGVALDLLPDLQAAGQFMWDQVAATDFPARVGLLAGEAARYRPAVIGLQEATTWRCTAAWWSSPVPVYDFTQEFLDATQAAGTPYVIASAGGDQALNPGYSIGPLPGVTVTDPATFQPIFGTDRANCGFTIADALLVRQDLAPAVQRVGTSEYEARATIVPTVLAIDRGYSWADIELAGTTARFVTTHLESLWDPGATPIAAIQAQQLVDDLSSTTGPLVVMGDFNSDPRDPRPAGAPNPGSQPEAGGDCPAQPSTPTVQTASSACSPYWVMRKAGFQTAGPDEFDAANFSWGASAELAGPDPQRLAQALQMGNEAGFTDRLDYVFVRNGAARSGPGAMLGNRWPDGGETWSCTTPDQIANTAAAGKVLAAAGLPAPEPGAGVCLPSDHAGVLAVLALDPTGNTAGDPPPTAHHPFRLVWWHVGLALLLGVVLLSWWLLRRLRGSRRRAESADADH